MEHVSKLVREMVDFASKVRDLAPRWVRLQQLDFQVNEWRSISDRTAIDPNILLNIESWLSFLGYVFDEKSVGRFGPGLEPQV